MVIICPAPYFVNRNLNPNFARARVSPQWYSTSRVTDFSVVRQLSAPSSANRRISAASLSCRLTALMCKPTSCVYAVRSERRIDMVSAHHNLGKHSLTSFDNLCIIDFVEPTVTVEFQPFVDGVRLKRRLPVIPRVRNGGVCIALAGNLFLGEVIHITSTFLIVLGAIGSIASIMSLVLYWHDKKK